MASVPHLYRGVTYPSAPSELSGHFIRLLLLKKSKSRLIVRLVNLICAHAPSAGRQCLIYVIDREVCHFHSLAADRCGTYTSIISPFWLALTTPTQSHDENRSQSFCTGVGSAQRFLVHISNCYTGTAHKVAALIIGSVAPADFTFNLQIGSKTGSDTYGRVTLFAVIK